jgi:hypothetical protein
MKFPLKNTPIPKFPMGNGVAQNSEEFMEALKIIRGWMLTESDWTQTMDSPLPEDVKHAWREWRQELRDITKVINVDNVQEWFEVSDPPIVGRPDAWNSWEYEQYNILYSIFEDLSKETEAQILYQEQQNQQGNHTH